jgi:hypothetical protein
LKLSSAENGQYYVNNVPAGEHDVVVTGSSLQLGLATSQKLSKDRGARLAKIKFLSGIKNEAGLVQAPKFGSVTGSVKLVGQSDSAGIDVYVPGTDLIAKTDTTGQFSLSNMPVGKQNFYFEKDGYHRGQIEGVTVESGKTATLVPIDLSLSTGAEGFVIIEQGAAYVNKRKVNLLIGATADAVLMKIFESPTFDNLSWKPVVTSTSYEFSSDGDKTLYIKFANANGLESSPFNDSIGIDTATPELSLLNIWKDIVNEPAISLVTNSFGGFRTMRTARNEAQIESANWVPFQANFTTSRPPAEDNSVCFQVKDFFEILSPIKCIQLSVEIALSAPRESLTAASVAGKIVFAGGLGANGASNVVDIFDSETHMWTTATLSEARRQIAAAVANGKVYFLGGTDNSGNFSKRIDIYDAATNTWSRDSLSQARTGLAGAASGNRAFFGGGIFGTGVAGLPNVIDVCNTDEGSCGTRIP